MTLFQCSLEWSHKTGLTVVNQSLKRKFKFTGPNQFLEFIFNIVLKKTEKLTGPNKVLQVLGRRTGAHREDCCTLIQTLISVL
jgi:hypothetical protein